MGNNFIKNYTTKLGILNTFREATKEQCIKRELTLETAGYRVFPLGTLQFVATSTGTLTVNFSSTSDDYIWFATPDTSTTKTVWFDVQMTNEQRIQISQLSLSFT